jgi:hypothetical protein
MEAGFGGLAAEIGSSALVRNGGWYQYYLEGWLQRLVVLH